jgi:hypothetical protein
VRGSIQPSSPGQSCDPALLLASCAAEQHHSRIVNSQLFGSYAATVGQETFATVRFAEGGTLAALPSAQLRQKGRLG